MRIPMTLEEVVQGFEEKASLLEFRVEGHLVVAKPKRHLGYDLMAVLCKAEEMGGDWSAQDKVLKIIKIPLRGEDSLIEDLKSGGLSDYESGKILKHLLGSFSDKYPTKRALASRLGKGTVWVSQRLRMLDLEGLVNERELSGMTVKHAGRILSLPREERRNVLEGIAKTGRIPSVAELEALPSMRALEPGPKAYAFPDSEQPIKWKPCWHCLESLIPQEVLQEVCQLAAGEPEDRWLSLLGCYIGSMRGVLQDKHLLKLAVDETAKTLKDAA